MKYFLYIISKELCFADSFQFQGKKWEVRMYRVLPSLWEPLVEATSNFTNSTLPFEYFDYSYGWRFSENYFDSFDDEKMASMLV